MIAESVLKDDNSLSLQEEPSVLTVPDIVYAPPMPTTLAPSLHTSDKPTGQVISQSLPSVENVSPGDEDCVSNFIPPSEPALDASVPIIEMFPGELESDDEDNDTICVGTSDPLHT